MKIGVLGTGVVGESISTALVRNGHEVMMGSRQAASEKGRKWVDRTGGLSSEGSFLDTSSFGEILFLCLNGEHVLPVLSSIPEESLKNKILIDLTNPLDFSQGSPPRILEQFREISLGERIQEEAPQSFVVKALNTLNYKLMVDARTVNNADHHLFICGNNKEAKARVQQLLADNFHWKKECIVDVGDIRSARCTEAIVPFWVLVWQSLGTPLFNFKVVQ